MEEGSNFPLFFVSVSQLFHSPLKRSASSFSSSVNLVVSSSDGAVDFSCLQKSRYADGLWSASVRTTFDPFGAGCQIKTLLLACLNTPATDGIEAVVPAAVSTPITT